MMRIWTPKGLQIVLEAAPPRLRFIVAMCIQTGARFEDAAAIDPAALTPSELVTRARKSGKFQIVSTLNAVWAHRNGAVRASCSEDPLYGCEPETQKTSLHRLLRHLDAEKRIAPGLTRYGLRQTFLAGPKRESRLA